jgi:drug/metabolite transporter (DMT)-like permease
MNTSTGRGILLMIGFALVVPMVDALGKFLIHDGLPPLFVVWGRFGSNILVVMAVIFLRKSPGPLSLENKGLQFVRSLFILGSTVLFFTALKTTPLADGIAILFTYPFIITALAPLLLGERAGLHRWAALIVGFGGALLIIRPFGGEIEIGHILCLCAAFCFAMYSLLTRRLSVKGDPLAILAFQGVVGVTLMSAVLPMTWVTPNLSQVGLFAIIGVLSTLGHFMLISAYAHASAPVLAPFGYFEIVTATLFGLFMFGDLPDQMAWAGISIIVISGIYISIREQRVARRKRNE